MVAFIAFTVLARSFQTVLQRTRNFNLKLLSFNIFSDVERGIFRKIIDQCRRIDVKKICVLFT